LNPPPVDAQTWFFFRLLESAAQPFVAVNLDLRFVLVNPAFAELTGYSAEELWGMTVESITPERWKAPGLKALDQLHSTGKSVRYEKEYLRKDGSLVPVEACVDLDRDDSGQIRGYFSFVTDASERKRAERALRESEEDFRRLYDEAPFGYHEIDAQGRIVNLNRTECEMLGYSRDEMIGRPIVDFVSEDQREAARAAVAEKIRGERPLVPIERHYQARDGRRLIVAIEERYRSDAEGRIVGLRSTMQDVTARKQTEAALVASERRARALFAGIEDIVFVHDLEGRILDANPAACRRLGYARDEFLTLRTKDLDDPEFAAGYPLRLKAQLEKRHVTFEGRHRTKMGVLIPVDISTSLIQFEDQLAVLAVCRDITERKALEETRRQFAEAEEEARRQFAEAESRNAREIEAKNRDLSRSEARYRQLTEGAHDAIVVADSEGRITLFNPAAERTFGYPAAEAIGRPLTDLMPMAVRDDRGVAPLVGRTVELTGRRKDGEEFPLELSLGELEWEGEVQYIGSIRDQAERQRMRAMLVQSEKLASIGLLSAGVAHEINNPLAYVGNNLAVLERDFKGVLAMMECYEKAHPKLEEVAPEQLRKIEELSEDLDWPYVRANLERMLNRTRDGVQRVANIVQNLRGLARTSPPKLEAVLIPELIAPALEMIQGRIRRRGVEVVQDHQNPRRVMCVAPQISQVMLNLLVNAIQAVETSGRDEGGRIEIKTRPVGDYYAIEIADDGCGIEPEAIPKLFDPFFTTKPVGEGTGLGLSISHGIVTGHGGKIEVESTPGVGTRFRVLLPLNPSPS
jgi:two-component system NtrC family sensor kinase